MELLAHLVRGGVRVRVRVRGGVGLGVGLGACATAAAKPARLLSGRGCAWLLADLSDGGELRE